MNKVEKESKIFLAGHLGLVGSAILNNLKKKGYSNFVLRTISELDLTCQKSVSDFFEEEKPEYVFLAAAKVGGIMANSTYRAQFIYENIMIQSNIIHNSWKTGVKKLLFLGSTCIYPREAPQPMCETSLLTSPLEYTNEPYAIAKIAGIKMCESYNLQYGTNFLSVMPTNLYGPNDNFDLEKSHVLPAIIRKIHLAKLLKQNNWDEICKDLNKRPIEQINGKNSEAEIVKALNKSGIFSDKVILWGSGKPLREFLWSEEMADACVYVMENVNFEDLSKDMEVIRNCHLNIGTGKEISIKNLAFLIKETVGYTGDMQFDPSKPDGTMRKLTDVSKLNNLGWRHKIEIEDGVKKLYEWYIHNLDN